MLIHNPGPNRLRYPPVPITYIPANIRKKSVECVTREYNLELALIFYETMESNRQASQRGRWPNMQSPCAPCRSMKWTPKPCLASCNRSGRRSPKPLPGFAGGSKRYWMRRAPRVTLPATRRTRPDGGGTSTSSCRSGKSSRAAIMPPYLSMTCRTSSANLREREATATLALEFLTLTAARSGEVLGARWAEFRSEGKVWTVPAARMKAGREHRVPLSSRALAILEAVAEAKTGEFVFAGQKAGKPLSGMAMEMVLRRMKVDGVTVHGFRSAFRDWCGEVNFLSARACRGGACACRRRCDREGLPAWRCARKAAQAHGSMG